MDDFDRVSGSSSENLDKNFKSGNKSSASPKSRKNRKKTLIIVLLVLFILSIFVFSALQGFVKSQAESALKKEINGTVKIGGSFVTPWSVTFYNVHISNEFGSVVKCGKINVIYNPFQILQKPLGQKAIKFIIVDKPEVFVSCDEKGRWNIENLIKTKERKPVVFEVSAPAQVKSGSFTFKDQYVGGFTMKGVPIEGKFTLQGKKGVLIDSLRVKIPEAGGLFACKGSLKGDFSGGKVQMEYDSSKAASVINYLIRNKKLKFVKGEMRVRGDVSYRRVAWGDPLKGLSLNMKVDLTKSQAKSTILPDIIDIKDARLSMTGEVISIEEMKGFYIGLPFSVSGKIIKPQSPSLDIFINTPLIPLEKVEKQPLYSRLPKNSRGNTWSSIRISGSVKTPVVKGVTGFTKVVVNKEYITKGQADFVYFAGTVRFNLNQAHWRNGVFRGEGYVNIEEDPPHFALEIKGENADVGQMAKIMFPDQSIRARSDFDVQIIGTVNSPLVYGDSNFVGSLDKNTPSQRGGGNFVYYNNRVLALDSYINTPQGLINCPAGLIDLQNKRINAVFSINDLVMPPKDGINEKYSIEAHVMGPFSSPVLVGVLTNGSLSRGKVSIDDMEGSFFYRKNRLVFDGISGRIGNGRVNFSGLMDMGADRRTAINFFAGDMNIRDLGINQIESRKKIDVSGFIDGGREGYQWIFTGYGSLGRVNSLGSYSPADSRLEAAVMAYDVDLDDFLTSDLSKKARLGRGDASILAWGSTSQINSSYLVTAPKGEVMGMPVNILRGDAALRGNSLNLKDSYFIGFRKDLGPKDDLVKAADGTLNGNINLQNKTLDMKFETQGADLAYIGQNFDFPEGKAQIRDIFRKNGLSGDLNVSGRISGSLTAPRWDGAVNVEDGIVNYEYFALHSKFTSDGKEVKIHQMELLQSPGEFQAQGSIYFKPKISMDLDLSAENGKISQLAALSPGGKIPLWGRLTGRMKVQGAPDKLSLDGNMVLKNAEVFQQPVSRLEVTMNTKGDTVHLEKMEADLEGGKLKGSGVMRGENLDFTFDASNFPLKEVRAIQKKYPDLAGNADFKMNLRGTVKSPEADVSVRAHDFQIHGQKMEEVAGDLKWSKNRLSINPLNLKMGTSIWNLAGTVDFPGGKIPSNLKQIQENKFNPRVDIESSFNNWQMAKLLEILDHPLKKDLAGLLDGTISVKGILPSPDFRLTFDLKNGRVGQVPVDKITASVTSDKEKLSVEKFEMLSSSSNSKASVSGMMGRNGKSLNFSLFVANLPLAVTHPFVPAMKSVDGNLNATASIWGDPAAPDVNAAVSVSKGSVGGFGFDNFGGLLNGVKGLVTFDKVSLQKGKQNIDFKGRIPIAFKNGTLVNTDSMEITADIKEKNLDILSAFVPYLEKTTGRLEGNIKISGMMPNLSVEGKTVIKNGSVKLSIMDIPVSNIDADMVFTGKELKINNLKGTLGQGDFSVSGGAQLNKERYDIENMNFILSGTNLMMIIPGLIRGQVDGKITLTGTPRQMIIGDTTPEEGKDFLKFYNATMFLPAGQLQNLSQILPQPKKEESSKKSNKNGAGKEQKSEAPAVNLPLPVIKDFIITMADDVWLDFSGLYIRSNGSLKVVRQSAQSIRVFGELAFSRGTLSVPFLRNPFMVSEGMVYFNGGDPVIDKETGKVIDYSLNPNIEVEAETRVGDYMVYLPYQGDLESLKMAFSPESITKVDLPFYSSPPLSQKSILELLLSETFLGSTAGTSEIMTPYGLKQQTTATVGDAAVSVMTNYLQGLLFAPITRSFGRAFSLMEFNLYYTPGGVWTIYISKALDAKERFFLTYSRVKGIQNVSRDIWGLEYKYRPNMRLRVENDSGTFIYSVKGQLMFDNFGEFVSELFKAATFRREKKPKKSSRPSLDNITPESDKSDDSVKKSAAENV